MSELTVLDLFSAAAGGWSLGLHRAGFETVAACEFVAWRRALYSQNNPEVRMYDDVCDLTGGQLLQDLGFLPGIVVGSPPCQDISSANTKGKGVEGERSGLYFEAVRIIDEVRPRWFALENSANLRTRGADAVLAALEAIGYTCWAFVVSAGDIGANHERARSWLIGCDLSQVADAGGRQQWQQSGRRGWTCRSGAALDSLYDPACSPDAAQVGHEPRPGNDKGAGREEHRDEPSDDVSSGGDPDHGSIGPGHVCKHSIRWPHGCESCDDAAYADQARQARQANGSLVPSLRQTQEPDDGCGAGRGDDRKSAGEMGLCPGDSDDAVERRADWSLDDLAHHLRVDAGLSAWVAQSRIAVGGPRGTSAASLIVEAFGDAVVPQIPEAIGLAILRTEAALRAIYGRAA